MARIGLFVLGSVFSFLASFASVPSLPFPASLTLPVRVTLGLLMMEAFTSRFTQIIWTTLAYVTLGRSNSISRALPSICNGCLFRFSCLNCATDDGGTLWTHGHYSILSGCALFLASSDTHAAKTLPVARSASPPELELAWRFC